MLQISSLQHIIRNLPTSEILLLLLALALTQTTEPLAASPQRIQKEHLPLTVAEFAKFIVRFPSGVVSSSKTCQYRVINVQPC